VLKRILERSSPSIGFLKQKGVHALSVKLELLALADQRGA